MLNGLLALGNKRLGALRSCENAIQLRPLRTDVLFKQLNPQRFEVGWIVAVLQIGISPLTFGVPSRSTTVLVQFASGSLVNQFHLRSINPLQLNGRLGGVNLLVQHLVKSVEP